MWFATTASDSESTGEPMSNTSSRREFLAAAAVAAAGLPAILCSGLPVFAATEQAQTYNPPSSPREKLDFNLDWRFLREDAVGAEAPQFDDGHWATVSTPHTFNDVDSFRTIISHSGGDRGPYKGLSWYRKYFKLPASLAGSRIFLEFEGMRQASDIFLNGKAVGLYENGITAYGIDISDAVRFGAQENVLAIKVDNRTNYPERATGTTFQWNANDFNPDYGGINRHVWLHVTGKIYQTLPLYYGLATTGVYVYSGNFDIAKMLADVTVESQVKNASGDRATVELSAVVVDASGRLIAQLDGNSVDMVEGEKTVITASGGLKNARFWSVEDPYLYDVYTVLKVDGKVVDVERTTTGFRKAEFRGGAGTGGVYLNDKFVYLKGFAQRASDEWASLGQAYPDWMHDFTANMIRACHGNYIRWMHVSPQKVDADAMARYGVIQVCPAGDKEADTQGRRWEQRLEVMRASMIYFRNNPSILFWEAGNTVVTTEHMQQMVALRKQWDPEGERVIGARGNSDDAANSAISPIAEYFGVMLGQDPKTDQLEGKSAIFRGYSADRRDRGPIIETEDFRDEGARRFWDNDSPPYFGFKKGPEDTYEYTSESFALAGIKRYWAYWQNRISNTDPAHSKWSGYASIYFSDSNADGRQNSSEVARVSGKVDAVRLPKEIYYAHRVMQSESKDLHILGHWSYPVGAQAKKTVKTIYVVANVESVELFLNGKSIGTNNKPDDGYVFAFPAVEFAPGSLKAIGRIRGKAVVDQELLTAGSPAAIRLTPIVGPQGLQADGQDVVLVDVEVVDVQGRRVPTDDARVDFTLTGPGIWRGGYNSGKTDSTNNLYLNTECGINRIAVRATLSPGTLTIMAKRDGLKPAQVQIMAKPVKVVDGIGDGQIQRLMLPS
ncbi:glycoside hydrolase family 2 sugar binding protein [Granulicella mallensis MP5ACTX8]|uniref:Glycoside hydrolase family 2 sugar binding protein n=2 Tax=Granulicella mallensis TaxID=940614 RepID=G8NWA4_GRAMM|nr:glycoside hydrolase family 2 sugar binding protein [Granulicella mallensis MP5ACTX8]